jgi:DNA-binding NarL/FixJ family response regulator
MTTKNYNILIVDDNPGFVKRMTRLLGELQNIGPIQSAGSCEEAIKLLDHSMHEMILLDINLPDKSGISLLKIIKERKLDSQVILISNHSDSFYREKCIKMGALHVLDKTAEFEHVPSIIADRYSKWCL